MNTAAISSKVKISALAIAVAVGGWAFYGRNRAVTDQAFINAPVVSIRAPIPGKTELSEGVAIGQRVTTGQLLATISTDTENPRVSELRGQIAGLVTQRDALRATLQKLGLDQASRRAEAADLKRRSAIQLVSDVKDATANLSMALANRERSGFEESEALRAAERATKLRTAGYFSQAAHDRLVDAHGQAVAKRKHDDEQVERAKLQLDAAHQGLQIDGGRGVSYVESRGRDVGQALADLGSQSAEIGKQIEALDQQIAVLQAELGSQQLSQLTSPVSGKVWDIQSNNGDAVARQAPVLQVVNCDSPWVEAFLSESESDKLRPGDRVKVRAYFDKQEWDGEVTAVRFGTGRVTVGQYLVDPPPEVMRRQLPVRIVTAKIKVDWKTEASQGKSSCDVGSSVEVYRA